MRVNNHKHADMNYGTIGAKCGDLFGLYILYWKFSGAAMFMCAMQTICKIVQASLFDTSYLRPNVRRPEEHTCCPTASPLISPLGIVHPAHRACPLTCNYLIVKPVFGPLCIPDITVLLQATLLDKWTFTQTLVCLNLFFYPCRV